MFKVLKEIVEDNTNGKKSEACVPWHGNNTWFFFGYQVSIVGQIIEWTSLVYFFRNHLRFRWVAELGMMLWKSCWPNKWARLLKPLPALTWRLARSKVRNKERRRHQLNLRHRSSKPLKRSGLAFALVSILGVKLGILLGHSVSPWSSENDYTRLTPMLWKLRVKTLVNALPACLNEIETLNVRNCQELVTHPFPIFFFGGW